MAHTATDTDRINRTAWTFSAIAALAGMAIVFSAPWSLQALLPPHAAAAFVFNPDFLPVGGARSASYGCSTPCCSPSYMPTVAGASRRVVSIWR